MDRVLAVRSSGRPLGLQLLRRDMEQRFGYDFSRVRVHSGAAAAAIRPGRPAPTPTQQGPEHCIRLRAGIAPGTAPGAAVDCP